MASSGNKSVQLCVPNAKAVYAGFYVYSNRFISLTAFGLLMAITVKEGHERTDMEIQYWPISFFQRLF